MVCHKIGEMADCERRLTSSFEPRTLKRVEMTSHGMISRDHSVTCIDKGAQGAKKRGGKTQLQNNYVCDIRDESLHLDHTPFGIFSNKFN